MSEFFRVLPLASSLPYTLPPLSVWSYLLLRFSLLFRVDDSTVGTSRLELPHAPEIIHILVLSSSWSSSISESIAIKPAVLASDLHRHVPTGSRCWESVASWESASTRLSAFHLFLHIWVGSIPLYLRIWAGKLGTSFNISLFPPHESSHPFGSTF